METAEDESFHKLTFFRQFPSVEGVAITPNYSLMMPRMRHFLRGVGEAVCFLDNGTGRVVYDTGRRGRRHLR